MAESKPPLRTYFRSQTAISESKSVYCTSHFRPPCTSGFVTLYRSVCRVRRFAVEQSPFRLGSAIRTIGWHALCYQPLIHITFVKGFAYHDFSILPISGPLHESGVWFIAANHKTGQRNRDCIPQCLFTLFYHLVRCQNRDSSWVPYFHFFGNTDNQP